MDESEWKEKVCRPCKQKMSTRDSSAWTLYCRRKDRKGAHSCTFANCPIKDVEKGEK